MINHQVIFFGSVAVTLTGVCITNPALAEEVKGNDDLKFFVRAAILPTRNSNAEERMGEYIDSSMFPLQTADMAEELLIPVMLERGMGVSSPAQSASTPSSSSSPQVSSDSPHCVTGNDAEESHPTALKDDDGGNDPPRKNSSGHADVRAEDDGCQVSVELHLEVAVVHGSLQSTIAHRTVAINSLLDITHEKCGVATARVGAAALRRSSAWVQAAQFFGTGRSVSAADEHNDDDGTNTDANANTDVGSGAEIHFIVRAVDMSEPVQAMIAAEREARSLLRLPQREPQTTFLLPALPLPYAALSLTAVYDYYRRFFEQFFNKTLSPSEHVVKMLQRDMRSDGSRCWTMLGVVDMRPTLLGEESFAPLLATLFHCPSLSSLVFDQNNLADFTCYWIAALFHKHHYLREVSLCRNNIHESGAEQLLRFARRNKVLIRLDASGNPCSPHVLERIQRVTEMNQGVLNKDPFNVFSLQYTYAVSPTSFSPTIIKKALTVWTMLSASPLKMADGASDSNSAERLSLIPQAALSPLLNEVMRTLTLRMSSWIQDPFVRMVFADVETPWKASTLAPRESVNSSLNKKNGEDIKDKITAKKKNKKMFPHVEMGREDENNNEEEESTSGGATVSSADVEEFYSYSFLRLIVVSMRSMMRDGNWADSMTVLQDIGRRQKDIGVAQEDYCVALKVFIQALTSVCGKERVDAEHSIAFLQCLAMGVRTAVGP